MLCVFPNDDYKHNSRTERGVDDFVLALAHACRALRQVRSREDLL